MRINPLAAAHKILLMMLPVLATLLIPCSGFSAELVLVLSSGDASEQAIVSGFKGSFSGEFKQINLEGSDEKQRKVGEQLQAEKPTAVVVVGDLAAQMAKWHLSGVPVVYCNSPRAAKIELTTEKAVGIYHETDPDEQLRVLSELFPALKRVGLIYSPEFAPVKEASIKRAAESKGLSLETAALNSIKELPDKLSALLPKVQLLWVLTDPVILSSHSIQYIVLQSISAKVPIFSGDDALAHGGATAGLVPDLEDMGAKAAQQTKRVMSGAAPQPGALLYPQGKLVLNQKTASLMQISFPPEMVVQAKEVIQ